MKSKLCNSAIKRSTFVHKQTQDNANPFGQLLQYRCWMCGNNLFQSGAHNPERAASMRSCHGVFTDQFIAFVGTHPNLVLLWYKGRNFRAITGDCRLAASINFIRAHLGRTQETGLLWQGRGWTRFRDLVSFSCRCHARRLRRTRIHNEWLLLVFRTVLAGISKYVLNFTNLQT